MTHSLHSPSAGRYSEYFSRKTASYKVCREMSEWRERSASASLATLVAIRSSSSAFQASHKMEYNRPFRISSTRSSSDENRSLLESTRDSSTTKVMSSYVIKRRISRLSNRIGFAGTTRTRFGVQKSTPSTINDLMREKQHHYTIYDLATSFSLRP